MNNQVYIPCPSCGALGILGSNCAFCGSTIQGKGNMPQSSTLITARKTISDDEYIRKTSRFNWVGTFTKNDIAVVFAGGQYGVINRNADLIIPLDYDTISLVEDFVLLERKQSCCIISVKFWDYLKGPDGEIITFSKIDDFTFVGECKTGQIDLQIGRRPCIYEPKNNTCILMDIDQHLYPLGKGFALRNFEDGYELQFGHFYSGYVLGDGTFIFRNKTDNPYSFYYDAHGNEVDTNADSVELRFRNLGWLTFKTNMDPEPQFKEFFEKSSEQSAKNAKSVKVYKILKIVVIIMFIWAITMFALAIFV